jgi:hypothetical protein
MKFFKSDYMGSGKNGIPIGIGYYNANGSASQANFSEWTPIFTMEKYQNLIMNRTAIL